MTAKENLTDIEINDLDPEAQDAAKHDVEDAWIDWDNDSEKYPRDLFVRIKRKHHDGRISQYRNQIKLKRYESVEDAILYIQDEIIDIYCSQHKGKDPADLEKKYPCGLFKGRPPGFGYGGEIIGECKSEDLWEYVDDSPHQDFD